MAAAARQGLDPFRPVPLLSLEEKVESVTCTGDAVYIGTAQGSLLHYSVGLAATATSAENLAAAARLRGTAKLSRRPVEQVCTTGQFVAALADGVVSVLPAADLASAAPVVLGKDARDLCAHTGVEDRDLLPELCVSYRKKLVLYAYGGKSFEARQEFPTPDVASTLVWHQSWIVAGFKREYSLYSDSSGLPREICQLDGKVVPRVVIVSENELLLMIQDSVGFFYNLSTQQPSQKGTITWPRKVVAAGTAGRYVLGSSGAGQVDVFGARDQKNSQTLTVQGAVTVVAAAHGGRAVVGSESAVTCLDPVPYERQVRQLLLQSRVADALDLLNTTYGPEDPGRELQLSRLHALAGWGLFRELQFSRAFQHFLYSADVKVARVLLFWRRYLPAGWDGASAGGRPAADDGAPEPCDVEDLVRARLAEKQGSEPAAAGAAAVAAHVGMASAALSAWLLRQREALLAQEHGTISSGPGLAQGALLEAVDTVLVKLLVETDEDDLRLQQVLDGGVRCSVEDLEPFLRERHRTDVLAKLCKVHGRYDMVLHEWSTLLQGEGGGGGTAGQKAAAHVPAERIVAEMVSALRAAARSPGGGDLIRRYAPRVLAADATAALPVFVEASASRSGGPLPASEVLTMLNDHPELARGFLEHLVSGRGGAEPEHAVRLARSYLEEAKAAGSSPDSAVRKKLVAFLSEAAGLDAGALIPEFEAAGLVPEKVVLCGRAGLHREALRVLVEISNDLPRAEIYCRIATVRQKQASSPREHDGREANVSIFCEDPPAWARGIVFGQRKPAQGAAPRPPAAAAAASAASASGAAAGGVRELRGDPNETRPLMLFLQVLLDAFVGAEQRPGALPKVSAEYKDAALALLMGYAAHRDMPPHEVTGMLPASWPLEGLVGYFSKCSRLCLHERRASMLEESLSSMAYLKTFNAWANERSRKVTMDKEKCCPTSNRRFVGQDNVAKAFVAYPNGTCVHLHCVDDFSVCPKTGQRFADNLNVYCNALSAGPPAEADRI